MRVGPIRPRDPTSGDPDTRFPRQVAALRCTVKGESPLHLIMVLVGGGDEPRNQYIGAACHNDLVHAINSVNGSNEHSSLECARWDTLAEGIPPKTERLWTNT